MFQVSFSSLDDVIKFVKEFKILPASRLNLTTGSETYIKLFKCLTSSSVNITLATTKDIYTDNNGHQLQEVVAPTLNSPITEWEIVDTSNYGVYRKNFASALTDGDPQDSDLLNKVVIQHARVLACFKALEVQQMVFLNR